GAAAEVARAMSFFDYGVDRLRDQLGFRTQAERMLQEHRGGKNGGQRIRFVAARDIGGAAVNRLEQPDPEAGAVEFLAKRGGRQHAHRAREDGSFVGQDVAEHVFGHYHVEVARSANQMHRHRVDELALEGDVLVFPAQLDRNFAPQARRRHHVRLVDRGELFAALARQLEAETQHPRDFLLGVEAGIDRFAPVLALALFAWLAVIDAAGELADYDEIDAGYHVGFERRCGEQFLNGAHRPQVGEQSERLAQAEQRLLGPLFRVGIVPLGTAHGAEQNRIGIPGILQNVVGKRSADGIERVAANQSLLELQIDRRLARDRLQDLLGLADDFGSDAVTLQN